jgi:exonuclease SbcC
LEALSEAASSGSHVLQQDAEARGRLASLRERSNRSTTVREAVQRLCERLGQPFPVDDERQPTPALLSLAEKHLTARTAALTALQTTRRQLASEYRQLTETEREIKIAREAIKRDEAAVRRVKERIDAAEEQRRQARVIAAAARRVRATIVTRVFNDSLNAAWRELFVRLAPDEPFVPAFKLPESADAPVVAALETVHRAGGRAGAPGAMLSAGNLNTAALTLFLALHLSVRIRLPWLVFDDPVQSMDEVHVSQFAALLRTLSKEHNRQIIIAVHDRALFDYLTLELSPAFADDQLITVELGRSADGDTVAEPSYRVWEPDPAIAVG